MLRCGVLQRSVRVSVLAIFIIIFQIYLGSFSESYFFLPAMCIKKIVLHSLAQSKSCTTMLEPQNSKEVRTEGSTRRFVMNFQKNIVTRRIFRFVDV